MFLGFRVRFHDGWRDVQCCYVWRLGMLKSYGLWKTAWNKKEIVAQARLLSIQWAGGDCSSMFQARLKSSSLVLKALLKAGGGTRARSKGEDLRSSGEGLRGFKSHPPHSDGNLLHQWAHSRDFDHLFLSTPNGRGKGKEEGKMPRKKKGKMREQELVVAVENYCQFCCSTSETVDHKVQR